MQQRDEKQDVKREELLKRAKREELLKRAKGMIERITAGPFELRRFPKHCRVRVFPERKGLALEQELYGILTWPLPWSWRPMALVKLDGKEHSEKTPFLLSSLERVEGSCWCQMCNIIVDDEDHYKTVCASKCPGRTFDGCPRNDRQLSHEDGSIR